MFTKKNEKNEKNEKKYICIKCHFKTFKKTDYDRHLLTSKHKKNMSIDISFTNLIEKNEKNELLKLFNCNCGKNYKSRQGLYIHKKKCNYNITETKELIIKEHEDGNIDYKQMFLTLMNDNKEMRNIIIKQQEQMNEVLPKIGNNNNNNTNIQNNKFNIKVFLNEQCKDAINMSDFIKSLHITIEQLDFTNKKGLADGLSKSIIENMNKLSIYKRPMHCTDTKRETLYIKDDDNWSKDINKEKIKRVINKASSKNYNALMEWKKLNPDFMNNEDKTDYFTKTISTIGKPSSSIDEKVIKNLCKETYVKNTEL